MKFSAFALPAALLLSLAGCGEVVPVDGATIDGGGSDIDGGGGGGPCDGATIAIEDLGDCVVAAQCDFLVRCEGAAATVEECIVQFGGELVGNFQRIIDSIAAEKTNYDAAAAATCLASFGDLSCNEEPGQDCDDVFVGTVADGGQCYLEEECSGLDADCDDGNCDDQCCIGICEDRALIGEDCSQRSCVRGARCDSDAGGRCVSTAGGSSCSSDFHCDEDLFCGPGGTCVAALGVDVPCVRDSQCEDPLTCIGEIDDGSGAPIPGACRPIDSEGDRCEGFCRNNSLFCLQQDGGDGMCVQKLGMGVACQNDNECEDALGCHPVERICTTRPGLGQMCQNNDCQPGLFCTSELPGGGPGGVCAEPVVTGMACDRDSHCETNICGGSQRCEDYMSCY